MGGALRVLQAGDFRLSEPLQPVSELPEPWRNILLQARERSARKVFDAALAQQVDLLLLTGTLGKVAEDPRAAWFLTEQFRRMDQHGVLVVWAATDLPRLPAWADLPASLQLLSPGETRVLQLPGRVKGVQLAWQGGGSSIADGLRTSDVSIQLKNDAHGLELDYAVWGRNERARHRSLPTQSHGFNAPSAGGIWLTACDHVAEFEPSFIETETVTWRRESLVIHPTQTWEDLQAAVTTRLDQCALDRGSDLILVQLELGGEGPLWDDLADDQQLRLWQEHLGDSLRIGEDPVWLARILRRPSMVQLGAWRDTAWGSVAEEVRQSLREDAVATLTQLPPSHVAWGRTFQEQRESPALSLRLAKQLHQP